MKVFFNTFFPFIVILFIWSIFSSPYFLKGKMPYSATYQVNNFAPWDAYPNLHGPVKNGAMPDVTTQIYPWKQFAIDTLKKGEIPLWNPNSFGGTPHVANYQSAVFTPFNILFFVFPFKDAWSLLILLQPLLAGICMYLFVRSLSVSKMGSLISAISFMFCGFITVWLDYGTLAYAILFLPLALFAIEKFYATKNIWYLILVSIVIPLSFFSGHFQISIYFLLTVLVYQVYKLITISNFMSFRLVRNLLNLEAISSKRFQTSWNDKEKKEKTDLKTALIIFLYTIFGLLIALPQILPSLEFYSQSLRSNSFIRGEVIPWGYLPTLLAPDFFGNPVTRNDWFGHYAEWNAYIGVIPFMLAWYALKKKNSFILFLFSFAFIIFLLAFPTPLLDLLVALHIPVLSTSAASRIIVLFSFLFIVLAGIGFDELLLDLKKNNKKAVSIWFLSFFSIFFLLWLLIVTKKIIPLDKVNIAKQNLLLPTVIFVGVFIALSVRVLLKNQKEKIYLSVISILLISFVAIDMLRFVTKWQAFDPKSLAFTEVPITQFFPKISGYERVLGNFGAETAVYYGLPSLEGYDALYINRYGQFIASLGNGKVTHADRSVVTFPKDSPYTAKAINLLNIKYIVHKISDDYTGWTFPYWKYPGGQFQQLYTDGVYRVYANKAVFPRAFLVSSYIVKTNPQEIFNTLFSKNFDLRHQLVLEKNPGISDEKDSDAGSAQVIQFSPNEMKVQVTAKKESLLFTSDPYYPGWKATVDGKSTEILRADFAFRAITVPAGTHTIVFSYQPMSFMVGVVLGIFGMLGIAVSSILFSRRKII